MNRENNLMDLKTISLLVNTLKDVPTPQLLDRIGFEIRHRIYRRLPNSLQKAWIGGHLPTPENRSHYLLGLRQNIVPDWQWVPTELEFNFLGTSKILPYPTPWNSPSYPRLWQFNLHYFDWIKDELNCLYATGAWSNSALGHLHLLGDWINHNPLGKFDGWHPYPTSLRVINWTWLVRAFPSLQTPLIHESLWLQVCYLSHNQETFFKGNHWFENLAALIIAGLNFTGSRSETIVKEAINQLSNQLAVQILGDGGHFERSPMYHLILLKRLCEVIACLNSIDWEIPLTFISSLTSMTRFAQGIRLVNGNYPLWNDCAYNIAEPLDEVLACAWVILGDSPCPNSAFNQRLFSQVNLGKKPGQKPNWPASSEVITVTQKSGIFSFSDSGYLIIRCQNQTGIAEITLDLGEPCPPSLPAHAHSDCLSFDLYWQGIPLIIETGTSQYGSGKIRQQERGTLAHNTVAFAPVDRSQQIFEQTQIWGSFRAASKAKPQGVAWGEKRSERLWYWATGTHDGYDRIESRHYRWLSCSQAESFTLIICDWMESKTPLRWLHRLHLGTEVTCIAKPNHWGLELGRDQFQLYLLTPDTDKKSELSNDSWHSPEFGHRFPRSVLTTQGISCHGMTLLCTVLTSNAECEFRIHGKAHSGWLSHDGVPLFKWSIKSEVPTVEFF